MPNPVRILAFSGSSRRESLNKKFLNIAVQAARAAGAEVTLIDLKEMPMPLYDGDLEDAHGMPENATKLVGLIQSHQGLLIASPEYNSMMSGLLKNTIDWCTRADENPFIGKVAGVISASPGIFGGVRSMTLVRQLLVHLGCHVIPVHCSLPQADKAFDEEGKLKVPRAQASVEALVKGLVEWGGKMG